jgi:glycosyltransferase involved in cell wall biosynthesis
MSVYDTEPQYLKEAVSSILNQTFKDFEFIIVDDGSNTQTKQLLAALKDPRIRILTNNPNIGLTKSLNRALKECHGTYIARMDADDISLPNRFQSQYDYMNQHPEYAVIGAKFTMTDRRGVYPKHWNDDMDLRKIHLLFYNDGISHPTAFFRSSFLQEHHLQYDESVKKAQDYAMWLSITDAGGRIGLEPEVLFTYRMHEGQITSNFASQMSYEQMTIRKQLDRFDPDFSEEDRQLFYHLYRGEITANEHQLFEFLQRLIEINNQKHLYDPELFVIEVRKIWKLAALKQIKKNHRFSMLLMETRLKQLK